MRIFIIDYARKMRFVELTLVYFCISRRGTDFSSSFLEFMQYMKRICSKCSRVRFPARLLDMRKTQFVEPTLYYNVIPTKSCRDAFLRLSKPPGLRKRRFHSALLLAETQECVSTLCNDRLCAQAEIRRIHVKYTVIFIYATKNVRFPTKSLGETDSHQITSRPHDGDTYII